MTYDLFFAGVGATLFGALLGTWLGARLTYGFQRKLLEQQLAFQRAEAEADAAQRKEIADAQAALFQRLEEERRSWQFRRDDSKAGYDDAWNVANRDRLVSVMQALERIAVALEARTG